jgi:fused signal recognition particle receptor
VLTDGLRAARSRGYDAVLVDTAGRLHTKGNLMAELAKMSRVAGREVPGAPHETLLVLDATTGGNAIAQAREFKKAGGITGLVLTKLDGTAKGGVAVAVVRELDVPIRYVGVGESVDDLVPFDAGAFVDALLGA